MRGYLNALLVFSFFVSEREAVTTNCNVRSGSNLTMTLDRTSMNVHQVSLYRGKEEIASSRSLTAGWDDFLDKKYENKLILSAVDNMTVHLRHVTVDDEGNYTTIVFLENGSSLKKYWNIKTEDFTEPELTGEFTISVKNEAGKYHCTCGDFKDNTIPHLTFKWNISSYAVHELLCKRNESVSCTASWPVSECQDVIQSWTASHRGEPATDGGNQKGDGRRKRSTDDTGCVPADNQPPLTADNTSPESTDEATTGHTEVTTVNNDVVVAATVPIAVIVVVVTVTTTVCCLRRKRKQQQKNRNVKRSEYETKDSPKEEKMEMMNQK